MADETNLLDELFPQTKGMGINSVDPSPESTPSLQAEPEPEPIRSEPDQIQPLRQQVDGLTQLLAAVVQNQNAPRVQQPDPQQFQQQYEQSLSYKDRDLFDKETSQALLTSTEPEKQLNKVFNRMAAEVFNPLAGELKKRDLALAQIYQEQKQEREQSQRQYQAQQNAARFYERHPNMAQFSDFIPFEAEQFQREAQHNLSLRSLSPEQVHDELARRVETRLRNYSARLNGEEGNEPITTRTAPNTMMERGSGTRAGSRSGPKDANRAALEQMSQWHRNGKRSA